MPPTPTPHGFTAPVSGKAADAAQAPSVSGVEDAAPLHRTESQTAATAGMGGPAPPVMEEWLQEQAEALRDQEVVLTACPPNHGETPLNYSGRLQFRGKWVLLRSAFFNSTERCVQVAGEDVLLDMPLVGWRYYRLVSLAVHQTEAYLRQEVSHFRHRAEQAEARAQQAEESADGMMAQVQAKDGKIAQLQGGLKYTQESVSRLQADLRQVLWQVLSAAGPPYASAPPTPQPHPAPHYFEPSGVHPSEVADVAYWGPWLQRGRLGVLELQYQVERVLVQPLIAKPGATDLTEAWETVILWMHMAAGDAPRCQYGPERALGNRLWTKFQEAHAYACYGTPA